MYTDMPKKQVGLTALILAISVMGDSMLYGVLPSHLSEFGLTAGFGAGLILSANRWIRLISNTWAARIFTRFGLRKPFYFSVVLAITSTAAYGLFQGFWPLLLSRIAWGICFSIQLVSLYMIVLRENEQYRGRLMCLYNAIFRSGSLIAVLVGGVLVDLIGIKLSFLIISSIMFLFILFSTGVFVEFDYYPKSIGFILSNNPLSIILTQLRHLLFDGFINWKLLAIPIVISLVWAWLNGILLKRKLKQ